MLVTLSLLSTYMVAPPVPRTAVRCADCRMDLFGDVAKAAGDMAKAAGDAATSLLERPRDRVIVWKSLLSDISKGVDSEAARASCGRTLAEAPPEVYVHGGAIRRAGRCPTCLLYTSPSPRD